MQANYGKVVSLYLETDGTTNYAGSFNTKENANNRPQLVVNGSSTARVNYDNAPATTATPMNVYPNPASRQFIVRLQSAVETSARLCLSQMDG